MSLQTAQFYMPARGERSAPSYDKSRPRELVRFFRELERLFVRASVTSEEEKKEQVLRYVDFEEEEFWQTLPEFKSSLATYDDFKAAILFCYPDASGNYLYSLNDIDLLIMERLQVGINNATDLADFHLRFHQITSWLVSKDHLCELEQRRAYVRAFRPPLMSLIANRLQIKFPDLHPNIPYPIRDVYEAAQYILHKSTSRTHSYVSPIPASSATTLHIPATPDMPITLEYLQSVFTDLTKMLANVLNRNSRRMDRSTFNRNNWDSNQSGAAYLRHATDEASIHASKLSPDNRIAQIEAELYALRVGESSFIHRADSARSAPIEVSDDEVSTMEKVPEEEITPKVIAQRQETRRMPKYDLVVPVIISAPHPITPKLVDPEQEHRTLEAKGTARTLFIDRNIAASISHIQHKSDTAYKALLSVHETPTATDPYVRLRDTQNAITQRHFPPSVLEDRAQTQEFTATCKEPTRTAHSFQNLFKSDNNETSDFSASSVVEALISPSSALDSYLTAISATSEDSTSQQLCLDNSLLLLSSSETSLALSNNRSSQNSIETPIGDPHETSDGVCDHISNISDSDFATIPATLDVHLEQSFSSTDSDKRTFSSNLCDLCDLCDSTISTSDSATSLSASIVSNYSDICDSDLKFDINVAMSELAVISNHMEALQTLSDICDPLRNIPTLDIKLTSYKPNSRYQQDRKANIIVAHHFLHILLNVFLLPCVSVSICYIFKRSAALAMSHLWVLIMVAFCGVLVAYLRYNQRFIRFGKVVRIRTFSAISPKNIIISSHPFLNARRLVIIWLLIGRLASELHNSFSANGSLSIF